MDWKIGVGIRHNVNNGVELKQHLDDEPNLTKSYLLASFAHLESIINLSKLFWKSKYSLHTIKFTFVKSTIQWFLVYTQSCSTITTV